MVSKLLCKNRSRRGKTKQCPDLSIMISTSSKEISWYIFARLTEVADGLNYIAEWFLLQSQIFRINGYYGISKSIVRSEFFFFHKKQTIKYLFQKNTIFLNSQVAL